MSEWRVHGCGSASSSRSLQSSYEWIEGDFRLQLDFGYGALYRRCCAEGEIAAALDSITHLFLSHAHPDHMADISRLAIALKYTPGYTPKDRVCLIATKKTVDDVRFYLDAVGFGDTFDVLFDPRYLDAGESLGVGNHILQAIPAKHREGSIGLRIHSPAGRKIAYTGDTGPYPGQEEYLRDLDLLAIESSFFNTNVEMHLTLEQIAELAGETQPRALTPVHLYPELERLQEVVLRGSIAKWYDGDVFIARDGLRLKWNEKDAAWQGANYLESKASGV